jgi:coenzyme F420 hydrogenase subunit beta
LHNCDLQDGRCYEFCPRTSANYGQMRESLFKVDEITPEIGAVKGYYLSRAVDPELRAKAQHGGTVTALLEVAMAEGMINAAIISARNAEFGQEGSYVNDKTQLRTHAGSKFIVSPTVAAFNQHTGNSTDNVGVVATPCQALALAKMKTAEKNDDRKIDQLNLVIGLFCGWTLSVERFNRLLRKNNLSLEALTGMDIPAGKSILELYTSESVISVPMTDVDGCIREACRYCIDSTAEFADISVGAARFGNNWEEMRHWNQIIVRTKKGSDLIDLAIKRGVLEVREAPVAALQELKNAAAEKKRKVLKNIIEKSGSIKNLLYLRNDDPVVRRFLTDTGSNKKKGKS